MGANVVVTAIVIIYLLLMLWIGWYSSTKITTNTDFLVAGRRLGPLLMARSASLSLSCLPADSISLSAAG